MPLTPVPAANFRPPNTLVPPSGVECLGHPSVTAIRLLDAAVEKARLAVIRCPSGSPAARRATTTYSRLRHALRVETGASK